MRFFLVGSIAQNSHAPKNGNRSKFLVGYSDTPYTKQPNLVKAFLKGFPVPKPSGSPISALV